MKHLIALCLILVGIIHLLPLGGVLGGEWLAALYALEITDPNLDILLRHRAVLFGLLGGFLIGSAYKPGLRIPAFAAGFISVLSFLWIAWATGDYNEAVARVVAADIVALLLLTIGLVAWFGEQRRNRCESSNADR